ncbi:MAG: sigma-70 region 4 domain-containing protein [Oscillospiraceae bacterium]|jgi:predicted DNA-binding protein YlxM (UPF0122 family)|nr:sigma-70 region 4 domain-containing protein [Oscillospiraceae bacterium]
MKKINLENKKNQVLFYSQYHENRIISSEHSQIFKFINKIKSKELTRKQKICLELYFDKKFSTKKIAEKLGINPTTAWRHINKAKLEIKEMVKRYYLK